MQEVEIVKGVIRDTESFELEVETVIKPVIVDIPSLADEFRGMKINGIEDIDGYNSVFRALQSLKKARTNLTKFAKSLRDEYTTKNNKIREIEKNYLKIITEVEDDLKAQREAIDEQKKRAERMILLPSRKKMLAEIEEVMTDEEILDLDEKSFATMYQSSKIEYLERKEVERKQEEYRKYEEERAEKEKEEAVKRAVEETERKAEEAIRKAEQEKIAAEKERAEAIARVEAEKQEAINRLNREHEEAEKNRIEAEKEMANERIRIEEEKKKEAERIEKERIEEQAKKEKNKKYQDWLVVIKYNPAYGDKIERIGDTFIAYKKIGEIVIK